MVSYLKACQTLGVSQLDSVIIAPPGSREGDSQSLADLQPAWEALEALVRNQQIAAIGTSDLDKDLLEQLYNWADVSVWHAREGERHEKAAERKQEGRSGGIFLLLGKGGSKPFCQRLQRLQVVFLEKAHRRCCCANLLSDMPMAHVCHCSVVVVIEIRA